jgi:purine-binding chemotaxis protein CheW
MATQSALSEQSQYLGFHIAGEEYAIGILRVREILEYDTVTKVPTTPASIRGVINLRGSVVPVIDLAVKLGLPESVVTKRSCVVVVEIVLDGERTVMGLLADAVSQVIDLPAAEIEPPPPFGTRVRVECLLGMGRAGKKFVLLLDIDRLLSTDDVAVVKSAADPATPVESVAAGPAVALGS